MIKWTENHYPQLEMMISTLTNLGFHCERLALELHQWMVFSKEIDTVTVKKVCNGYVSSHTLDNGAPGFKIASEYYSEGNNALSTHTVYLDNSTPLSEQDVRLALIDYTDKMQKIIDTTFARRLYLSRTQEDSSTPSP